MRKTEIWDYLLIPTTITTVPPTKKKNPSPGNYRKDIWLNTENNRGGQTEMVLERQAGTRSRIVCSTAKNLNHKFRSMITTT